MIDLYWNNSPNADKVLILLEELQIPYHIKVISFAKKEQFSTEFLKISPNNKIPAIVDYAPLDTKEPLSLFESGAILLYLAEKYQRFLSSDKVLRNQTLQWLFWQVSGLGPMLGQNHYFVHDAKQKIDFAIERYLNETSRLYRVLNQHLNNKEFIAGYEYSIADIACYPWLTYSNELGQNLDDYPHIQKWFNLVAHRPAINFAKAKGKQAQNLYNKLDVNHKS